MKWIAPLLFFVGLCVIAYCLMTPSDPMPEFPNRVGPDGGPAPLTEDEFRRLQDWMRRNKDKL